MLKTLTAAAAAIGMLAAAVRVQAAAGDPPRPIPGTRVTISVDASFQGEDTLLFSEALQAFVSVAEFDVRYEDSDDEFDAAYFRNIGVEASRRERHRFGDHDGKLFRTRRTLRDGKHTVTGYTACFGDPSGSAMVEVLGVDGACTLSDADLRRIALSSRWDPSSPRPRRAPDAGLRPDRSLPLLRGTRLRADVHAFTPRDGGMLLHEQYPLVLWADEMALPYPSVAPLVRPGVSRHHRGVIIESVEPHAFVLLSGEGDGRLSGQLARVRSADGRDKGYLAVLGTDTHCSTVLVLTPADLHGALPRLAHAIASGVQFDLDAAPVPQPGSGFDLSPVPPLALVSRSARDVVLMPRGAGSGDAEGVFYAEVEHLERKVYPRARQRHAESVLQKLRDLRGQKVRRVQPVTIDGLEGFEVFAEAVHRQSDAPVRAYLVVLFEADRCTFVMLGLQRAADPDAAVMDAFAATARTFRRVKAGAALAGTPTPE